MKKFPVALLAVAILCLAACSKGGDSKASASAPASPPAPVTPPSGGGVQKIPGSGTGGASGKAVPVTGLPLDGGSCPKQLIDDIRALAKLCEDAEQTPDSSACENASEELNSKYPSVKCTHDEGGEHFEICHESSSGPKLNCGKN